MWTAGIVALHTGIRMVWSKQHYKQNMFFDSLGGCLDATRIVWDHQQSPGEQMSKRYRRRGSWMVPWGSSILARPLAGGLLGSIGVC